MSKLFNKNILYVEDDINTQEEVSFFLQTFTKNIFTANNGKDALESFYRNKIDLIITDIQMPKMDGIEMIREIKKTDTTIPIIILTAFNESKHLVEALNLGVSNYLFKPTDLREIKKSIFEHLGGDQEGLLKCSLNERGEIVDINEHLLQYLGYSKEFLLNKSFLELVDPICKQELIYELKNLSRTEFINNFCMKFIAQNDSKKEVVLDMEMIRDKVSSEDILISCQMQSLKHLMSSKNNIVKILKQEKSLKDLINIHTQIGKSATSVESVKDFFQVVCDDFVQNIEYQVAFISKIYGDDLQIINYAQNRKDEIMHIFEDLTIKNFLTQNSIMSQAYKNNSISVIENLDDIKDYENKEMIIQNNILSLVSIPLRFNEKAEVFGILTLMLSHTHKFIKEEFNLFDNIADMIILGVQAIQSKVEKENLLHELYLQATHDFLTNCINRQEGVNIIKKEIERSNRYENKLCMVFFDIDKFKVINDNYGHNIGDKVLVAVSKNIKNSLRMTDYIIRWGGEEFLILLPQIDLDMAISFTKKMQEQMRSLLIENLQVTLSIGVTEYKANEAWEEFVERADQLMYQAKNSGRDQYISG